MDAKHSVEWSKEAEERIESVYNYLLEKWTEKEANNFLDLLIRFERRVSRFPEMYPQSEIFKGCRKAVIHPHISAIYKVQKGIIYVATLIDNRADN
jgi:plasmid stabilization system protein ParE